MTDEKNPTGQLLDLLVYAPLGLLGEARVVLPDLAAKGRQRVTNARVIGQFAVQMGQAEAGRRFGRLESQARRSLVEFGLLPPEPPAPSSAPARAPAPAVTEATPAAAPVPRPAARKASPSRRSASATKAAPGRAAKAPSPARSAATRTTATKAAAPKAAAAPDRAAAPSAASLAIPDYDSLAASQVVSRLDGLRPDELAAVQRYELANRGRKTIIGKIAQIQTEG